MNIFYIFAIVCTIFWITFSIFHFVRLIRLVSSKKKKQPTKFFHIGDKVLIKTTSNRIQRGQLGDIIGVNYIFIPQNKYKVAECLVRLRNETVTFFDFELKMIAKGKELTPEEWLEKRLQNK